MSNDNETLPRNIEAPDVPADEDTPLLLSEREEASDVDPTKPMLFPAKHYAFAMIAVGGVIIQGIIIQANAQAQAQSAGLAMTLVAQYANFAGTGRTSEKIDNTSAKINKLDENVSAKINKLDENVASVKHQLELFEASVKHQLKMYEASVKHQLEMSEASVKHQLETFESKVEASVKHQLETFESKVEKELEMLGKNYKNLEDKMDANYKNLEDKMDANYKNLEDKMDAKVDAIKAEMDTMVDQLSVITELLKQKNSNPSALNDLTNKKP